MEREYRVEGGRARAKIREAQIQMNTEVLVSDPTKKNL